MSDVESTEQTESTDDLWHVQLPSGQACRMTLEMLDDAFQDGLIHEDTLIRQDGTNEWLTLREVAGLDSSESAESETPAAPSVAADTAQGMQSVAQVVSPNASAAAASMPEAAMPQAVSAPAVATPAFAQDPFALPVTAAVQPQMSYAPPPDVLTRSTAPVATDIGSSFGADLDLDAMEFSARSKRSPAKWIIGIAAVLGGLGFAVMSANSTAESLPTGPSTAAAHEAAPYVPPTPAAAPPQPSPAAKVDSSKGALSDEQKRALASADKNRAAKFQQTRQAKGGGSAPAPRRGKSDPFHKGGDKYDPLNSSL